MAARAVVCVALALAAAGLAGCAASHPAGEAAAALGPRGQFGDDTGAVEGLVTDDEYVPVAGAQVALLPLSVGREATTDAQGRFALSDVPPGHFQVVAAHIGYEPAQGQVEVVAGTLVRVELRLVPLPVPEPWTESLHHTGFMGTGVAFVRSATCSQCGSNATSYFLFGGFPLDYQGMVAEAKWATQDYLGFDLNARAPLDKMWYRTRSKSPVHYFVERCGDYTGPPRFGRNPMPCSPQETNATIGSGSEFAHLETWYLGQFLNETQLLNPVCQTPTGPFPGYQAGCYGLGAAQDLRWETWVSIFHMELPQNAAAFSMFPEA